MARVSLRLPPQLLESARAAQLANRQALLAREARTTLRARALVAAEKARAVQGLPRWPGAVPEREDRPRAQLWTRRQVLSRGLVRRARFILGDNFPSGLTISRDLRLYSLDGSSYIESKKVSINAATVFDELRYPSGLEELETFGGVYVMSYPVSESSYLMVRADTKTVTAINNPGVSTVVGGLGPAYVAIAEANPNRYFSLFQGYQQGWPISWIYVLGQDTFSADYKAWLVHETGAKEVPVPTAFVQQATQLQPESAITRFGVGPAWFPDGGNLVQSAFDLRIYRQDVGYTVVPQIFNVLPGTSDVLEFDDFASFPAVGQFGKLYLSLTTNRVYEWLGSSYDEINYDYGVQTPPFIALDPGAAQSFLYNYLSRSRFLEDYDERLPQVQQGDGLVTFTITPPNQQALPRAPVAYLQDLGFSTADLTP